MTAACAERAPVAAPGGAQKLQKVNAVFLKAQPALRWSPKAFRPAMVRKERTKDRVFHLGTNPVAQETTRGPR